jgi:hypothetical protein
MIEIPDEIPDRNKLGAMAEAVLEYQKNNPSASIDDIMAFCDTLKGEIDEEKV